MTRLLDETCLFAPVSFCLLPGLRQSCLRALDGDSCITNVGVEVNLWAFHALACSTPILFWGCASGLRHWRCRRTGCICISARHGSRFNTNNAHAGSGPGHSTKSAQLAALQAAGLVQIMLCCSVLCLQCGAATDWQRTGHHKCCAGTCVAPLTIMSPFCARAVEAPPRHSHLHLASERYNFFASRTMSDSARASEWQESVLASSGMAARAERRHDSTMQRTRETLML